MNDLDLLQESTACVAKQAAVVSLVALDRTEITALLRSLEDEVLPMPAHIERIITEALAKEKP